MVHVTFLHPDLGIGGAERLVVDAALALQSRGHSVHFVTNHHDKSHCFEETRNGTFPVTVVGDWLPRSIFGFAYALCAYIRMIYAALYIVISSSIQTDVIFCDSISYAVPVLHWKCPRVLFYCHYPDQLMSKPGGSLKRMYRAPLNWIEEKTTGQADKILVNSKFTRTVFQSTFKSLSVIPDVLYPSINTDLLDGSTPEHLSDVLPISLPDNAFIFLSINRYEKKKDHGLALAALGHLKNTLPKDLFDSVRLIVAGGYDRRVTENIDCYAELVVQANQLQISSQVIFLKSPSDAHKLALLVGSHCILYTPTNEHFGIVPLEAMYTSKPVIATNTGGPTETVVDGKTGYLTLPEPKAYAEAMATLVRDRERCKKFGLEGRKRFREHFSFKAFTNQLDMYIDDLMGSKTTD
ncbi:hypothetical protein ONE63_000842 [Megalurothrips usitatus]|nr:hypothetical protein ONE63_000842 [Megalurothrips usitatus]